MTILRPFHFETTLTTVTRMLHVTTRCSSVNGAACKLQGSAALCVEVERTSSRMQVQMPSSTWPSPQCSLPSGSVNTARPMVIHEVNGAVVPVLFCLLLSRNLYVLQLCLLTWRIALRSDQARESRSNHLLSIDKAFFQEHFDDAFSLGRAQLDRGKDICFLKWKLQCPLGLSLLQNPVIAGDGYTCKPLGR